MPPKLSVVVPVYNVEKYLEKCLVSLENQTFNDFEVIIVNDGSSDSSLAIATSFHARDQRFKVISQDNLGLGGARNTAVASAQGEYVFMLDSDDYIKPNTFETLVAHMEKNDLDILVFNYQKVDELGNLISAPKQGNNGVYSKDEAFKKILSMRTSPQSCNKLYRTSLFRDGNIFYPEKFLHEDIAVTYRLFWFADKIGYINKSFYYWVVRSGSITQDFNYKHINDVVTSLTDIKRHLIDNSVYSTYQTEYVEGCIKMFNVLFDRAIEHQRYACMDYLLFLLASQSIISERQVEDVGLYDKGLFLMHRKNLYLAKEQSSKFLLPVETRPIEKKVTVTLPRSRSLFSSSTYYCKSALYEISYFLFPLGSGRREGLKKLMGSWRKTGF